MALHRPGSGAKAEGRRRRDGQVVASAVQAQRTDVLHVPLVAGMDVQFADVAQAAMDLPYAQACRAGEGAAGVVCFWEDCSAT